ncbi:unnamed protein product, partial [Nesidiocoris tenuis]
MVVHVLQEGVLFRSTSSSWMGEEIESPPPSGAAWHRRVKLKDFHSIGSTLPGPKARSAG